MPLPYFLVNRLLFWRKVKRCSQRKGGTMPKVYLALSRSRGTNPIRNLLDPLEPRLFYPVFSSTFEHLEKAGPLKAYRFFEGCLLVALDGTE